MESQSLARLPTKQSYFNPSHSPYFKPTSPSVRKKFSTAKTDNSEKALLRVQSERNTVEDLLETMEKRVAKLKRKEEHAARKLALARDKAQVFTSTREFVKDVTNRQMEIKKQKQREETQEKLNKRRREVLLQRLDREEQVGKSKTSLLDTRRVLYRQKLAMEEKKRKVDLLNTAQERRLRDTLYWGASALSSNTASRPQPRSKSEDEEKAVQQESRRIHEVSTRVTSK